MWKIFFEYSDGGKITVTGRGRGRKITLEQALRYYNNFGVHASKATYQQYPKKDHVPVELLEKIKQLKKG